VSGLLAVDRGRLQAARHHLETARYLSTLVYDGRINGLVYRGLAELALWEGQPDDAIAAATAGLDLTGTEELQARLAVLVVRAAADGAEAERAAGRTPAPVTAVADALAALDDLEARAAARRAPDVSEIRAAAATGAAERTRLEGRSDARAWQDAARRWSELGFPAPAAYCQWREATALLAAARRPEAVAAWRRGHRAAVELGAAGLRAAIEADAARAAIALEGETVATESPYGLTSRELEVLALVAAGHTNRQIGDALFISEKTASVHVSHILAKLGASTRAQAAAVASRLGLVRVP
jgi:DNA-binding CsgD family transcriptional regulator